MRVWRAVAAAILLLVAVVVVNTLRVPEPAAHPPAAEPPAVPEAAVERLAGALRIQTVSYAEPARIDWTQWQRLHDYLEENFPATHRALRREVLAGHSLLYTWEGTDPAAAPFLMLAHQDVGGGEPGTESRWTHPPFDGVVADGFLWGRGALDDKGSLLAQLEAVEALLSRGFRPSRTIYFAFGHDEELGGMDGAAVLASTLAARGVRAEFALDEGGAITQGIVAGVEPPVAMVATAEKGYASFQLRAGDTGGHSSRPPPVTAIGRVARAVARLQDNPLPVRLAPPVDTMLERLAPQLPFGQRLAIANLWLFRPLVAGQLAKAPLTGAMVRTTTAPTVFRAGVKDNVLPAEATATVNFRVLPGDSTASVEAHIRRVVDDPDVEITLEAFASEPSPVADPDTPSFRAIEQAVHDVFPAAVVTPGLVIGATDNRHYAGVRGVAYNFLPVLLADADVQRVHGTDERIGVEAYRQSVRFYMRFIERAAGAPG